MNQCVIALMVAQWNMNLMTRQPWEYHKVDPVANAFVVSDCLEVVPYQPSDIHHSKRCSHQNLPLCLDEELAEPADEEAMYSTVFHSIREGLRTG